MISLRSIATHSKGTCALILACIETGTTVSSMSVKVHTGSSTAAQAITACIATRPTMLRITRNICAIPVQAAGHGWPRTGSWLVSTPLPATGITVIICSKKTGMISSWLYRAQLSAVTSYNVAQTNQCQQNKDGNQWWPHNVIIIINCLLLHQCHWIPRFFSATGSWYEQLLPWWPGNGKWRFKAEYRDQIRHGIQHKGAVDGLWAFIIVIFIPTNLD